MKALALILLMVTSISVPALSQYSQNDPLEEVLREVVRVHNMQSAFTHYTLENLRYPQGIYIRADYSAYHQELFEAIQKQGHFTQYEELWRLSFDIAFPLVCNHLGTLFEDSLEYIELNIYYDMRIIHSWTATPESCRVIDDFARRMLKEQD